MERTLVIIKPDAVRRELIGKIISRIERIGWTIEKMRMVWFGPNDSSGASIQILRDLYAQHAGQLWFEDQIKFMHSGPCIVLQVRGENVIYGMRRLAGATAVVERWTGTIRGDYSCSQRENLVHCSDSEASAEREINLLF